MKLAFFITHLARSVTPLGKGVSVYLHASFSPDFSSFTRWPLSSCARLSPNYVRH